ncbi:MAG TPA: hypothetical protein VMT35_10620 [Ignavibacteriaceae bacterium]|nr:hypothetical protein [Ignavibacteriaceae bacterium]
MILNLPAAGGLACPGESRFIGRSRELELACPGGTFVKPGTFSCSCPCT